MVYFGDAYKRIIEPGPHTHSIAVAVERITEPTEIRVIVAPDSYPSSQSWLSIEDAEALAEALAEAIGLAKFARDFANLVDAGKYREADSLVAFPRSES